MRPLFAVLIMGLLLAGCADKKPKGPQPETIHLRGSASVTSPSPSTQLMKKNLFNIVVSKKSIQVNGAPVKDLKELEKLLARHQQPALTIATHKCLSNDKAAEIIQLAQRHTDTPIAFGSYGDFNDPECD